jgi:hypothetical protein
MGLMMEVHWTEFTVATQKEKAESFKALHERAGAFIIPNPWDIGSARLLAGLGFEALATTSAGFANSLGRLDGHLTLNEVMEHCRNICAATDLSVSADLVAILPSHPFRLEHFPFVLPGYPSEKEGSKIR